MEIKCNFHPINVNNNYTFKKQRVPEFRGYASVLEKELGKSADKFVRRPVATTSATGLHGLKDYVKKLVAPLKAAAVEYTRNIERTIDHKIIFALVEKELFGKNSIDSITHDLDKLILYILGFSKSFVSKFHRTYSEHHIESGKKPNLRSMVCDNIASSPEFKPEKKLSLREYYKCSNELQKVNGFGAILEKVNFGENINFEKILEEKKSRYKNAMDFMFDMIKITPRALTESVLLHPLYRKAG